MAKAKTIGTVPEVLPALTELNGEHHQLQPADWDILEAAAKGFCVDVGTFHGASACALLRGGAKKVTSLDTKDWQPKVLESSRVSFFYGDSVKFAETLAKRKTGSIDVLFIDGDHSYESVMRDCKALIPHVKKNGLVLFHDHNPGNPNTGVYEAVNDYLRDMKHRKFSKVAGSGNLLKVQKL